LFTAAESRQSVPVDLTVTNLPANLVTVNPTSLTFNAPLNSPAPPLQTLTVNAPNPTRFTATSSTQSGGANWLTVSPSGSLTTNQALNVSVNPAGLGAGSYGGAISVASNGSTRNIAVTLLVTAPGAGGGGGPTGYKLIGWNDLGMHCQDGKDYSIFAVLPPFNTIHAHLIDAAGRLVSTDIGYTIGYQAVSDPLTNTLNTTSAARPISGNTRQRWVSVRWRQMPASRATACRGPATHRKA
jgi:hypothetical protein